MVLPRLICEMIWALYWSVLSERLLGDRVRPDVVFWYVLPLGAIVKREMAANPGLPIPCPGPRACRAAHIHGV